MSITVRLSPAPEKWTGGAVQLAVSRLPKSPAVKAKVGKTRIGGDLRPDPLDELRAASVEMVRTGEMEPITAPPVSGDVLPPEHPQTPSERTRQAFAHSLAGCIADHEKAMEMAEAAGNAAAYSRAAEVKAKLLGHMTDRSEGRHLHAVVDPDEAKPDINSIWRDRRWADVTPPRGSKGPRDRTSG